MDLWHHVQKELPKDGMTCLVSTYDTLINKSYVGIASYFEGEGWTNRWGSWCEEPDVEVIAWIELPKPVA